MKLAIHNRPGSFSDHWIKYCNEKNIPYKLVSCYDSDIITQLDECEGLMWHWDITDYKTALFARQLTLSLESKGIRVFPDSCTSWHYDDKVGQKYLLEAIKAPLIPSWVFYSKKEALEWIKKTSFPKVFKLRNGAGSSNVKLVRSKKQAQQFVKRAFKNGFSPANPISRIKERLWILQRDKNLKAVKILGRGIARFIIKNEIDRFYQKERGYIYFQEFIPNNEYDTRLVVVGNQCFGLRRFCRNGDFRASGSGLKDYNHNWINTSCVKIAFRLAKQLKTQSVAFDFIKHQNEFKLVEISYAFTSTKFPGYWDTDLNWCKGEVSPQEFMIKNFLHSFNK